MYRTILVPLDGSPLSEAALAHIPHLAGAGSEVILLRVTPPAGEMATPVVAAPNVMPVPPVPRSPQMREGEVAAVAKAFADAEEYLKAKADAIHGTGARTRTMVIEDIDAAAVIASQAEAEQADLVVMSTHGRSGVVRWALGSVADRILHTTHIPLLLIHPGRPTT